MVMEFPLLFLFSFLYNYWQKIWARATISQVSAALYENTFCIFIFRFKHFHLGITEKKFILNQLDIDFQSPK